MSRARLPARPLPLHDELVSSWLVRLARANAMKVQELLALASGLRRSIMGCDLDSLMDEGMIKTLEHLCGASAHDLASRTFASQYSNLTAIEPSRKGTRRWILPMASKMRRPTAPWLQFCLACLQQDAVPYFRRQWRYAFLTTCSIHQQRLHATCPFCNAPFDFLSHDIGQPRERRIVPVSECSACRRDIRAFSANTAPLDGSVVRYEQSLVSAAKRGWSRVHATGWVYSHQVLDVIHRLLRMLRSSPGLLLLFREAVAAGVWVQDEFVVPDGRFETWPLQARHQAMTWISSLFRGWPDQFVTTCTRFHVLSYAILGHRGEVPYWFARIVDDHLYRPWYAPAAEEIASVSRAIAGAGQPDVYYNRRRWLGRYYEKKAYIRQIIEGPGPRQLELFEGAAIEGKAHLVTEVRLHVGDMLKHVVRSTLDHLLASVRIKTLADASARADVRALGDVDQSSQKG